MKIIKIWAFISGVIAITIAFSLVVVDGDLKNVYAAPLITQGVDCDRHISIMPLGDSITVGKSSGVVPDDPAYYIAYRKDLWDRLQSDGYQVDFVGTQINGQAYAGFDPDHEGHSGETDKYIADNIYNAGGENWLDKNPPDLILLHIGTNAPRDPNQIKLILDEIDEYEVNTENKVVVIVALIINQVGGVEAITTYNNQVKQIVEGRIDYGTEVFYVDMEKGAGIIYQITPDGDMWNTIHPYATGYTKMAVLWRQAIASAFPVCHTVYVPLISRY